MTLLLLVTKRFDPPVDSVAAEWEVGLTRWIDPLSPEPSISGQLILFIHYSTFGRQIISWNCPGERSYGNLARPPAWRLGVLSQPPRTLYYWLHCPYSSEETDQGQHKCPCLIFHSGTGGKENMHSHTSLTYRRGRQTKDKACTLIFFTLTQETDKEQNFDLATSFCLLPEETDYGESKFTSITNPKNNPFSFSFFLLGKQWLMRVFFFYRSVFCALELPLVLKERLSRDDWYVKICRITPVTRIIFDFRNEHPGHA